MAVLRVEELPEAPLEAADEFYGVWLNQARYHDEDLVLLFPPADHTHRAWRLAVVQELARVRAPRRINAIAGDDEAAIADTIAYLERSPGVTGQLLAV
jgi:hypothetical protein